MGAKQKKKAAKKTLHNIIIHNSTKHKHLQQQQPSSPSLPPTATTPTPDHHDFLPLQGSPSPPPQQALTTSTNTNPEATVLYIGHIPHGFYEQQMHAFFQQFGTVKRLRLARNRKTGKSKHYAFLEFANPEVAKVVAREINNYLLFEHNLQIHLVPPPKVHPKLWKGVNRNFKPPNLTEIARRRHNKERTLQEHQKMVQAVLKRDEKRRKRIKEAGIDYECPDLVGKIQPRAKKVKFTDDED